MFSTEANANTMGEFEQSEKSSNPTDCINGTQRTLCNDNSNRWHFESETWCNELCAWLQTLGFEVFATVVVDELWIQALKENLHSPHTLHRD